MFGFGGVCHVLSRGGCDTGAPGYVQGHSEWDLWVCLFVCLGLCVCVYMRLATCKYINVYILYVSCSVSLFVCFLIYQSIYLSTYPHLSY